MTPETIMALQMAEREAEKKAIFEYVDSPDGAVLLRQRIYSLLAFTAASVVDSQTVRPLPDGWPQNRRTAAGIYCDPMFHRLVRDQAALVIAEVERYEEAMSIRRLRRIQERAAKAMSMTEMVITTVEKNGRVVSERIAPSSKVWIFKGNTFVWATGTTEMPAGGRIEIGVYLTPKERQQAAPVVECEEKQWQLPEGWRENADSYFYDPEGLQVWSENIGGTDWRLIHNGRDTGHSFKSAQDAIEYAEDARFGG